PPRGDPLRGYPARRPVCAPGPMSPHCTADRSAMQEPGTTTPDWDGRMSGKRLPGGRAIRSISGASFRLLAAFRTARRRNDEQNHSKARKELTNRRAESVALPARLGPGAKLRRV